MYRPKYFDIEEVFNQRVCQQYGERAWQFMDPGILMDNDLIREIWGPTTINNWATGGQLDSCGWRPIEDKEGASDGAHRLGNALDAKPKFKTMEVLIEAFRERPSLFIKPDLTKAFVHFAQKKMIGGTVEAMRQFIIANPDLFPHITRLEIGVGWLHMDSFNVDTSKGKVLFSA